MKVLVIGSGGREHAMVWKIAQSPLVEEVFCAPGNAGIAGQATCVSLKVDDIDGLLAFAQQKQIDLTVVGPELPLTLGVVDRFRAAGLTIFGATRDAAQIEGSKSFCKDLMAKYGVPTASYGTFTDCDEAVAFIKQQGAPIVVKADGLAAGKGVILADTVEQAVAAVESILCEGAFGSAGARVVIEEFLEGEEASFLAFTDGERIVPLASSQDHKAAYDGDTGPNTGGMGAYSPAPVVTPEIHDKIIEQVLKPTIAGMAAEGCAYSSILYAGLMIKDGELKVLEFNARFGDPETQPLLARLKSDIVPVLLACARGDLSGVELEWHDKAAVCVVMASGGYPGDYAKGHAIDGLDAAAGIEDLVVFHAGTTLQDDSIVTAGGRVLGVTGLGTTVAEAIERAYQGVKTINWKDVHYRSDIGRKALNR
ncbi:phosphoribosylamine--glycine ligase [Syntrophotalea carbinolica DSM 2380]|uniref:Phosphoribosylamine--glycine ligase n=1 Tax=Syntrophotalea carbinolica (strain DSM 2380 / NBRC 103641 / GraBd1) TaxID=338963 RepID=Q3A2D7_SYNC1|nr:phosphoribosylamine--glycine ligase [Syntrophotalea carbinolica]ABA89470.1 phosphoribosylamine--glycine ligase [Syntrophotalea carbinolica DSM 2380]